MSTKSHAHIRCGTLRKSSISTKRYSKIHIQKPFFDNKNSIWKILGLIIRMVETCSSASSTHTIFIFEKYKNLWWYFKVLFFGKFWAEFATLTMAKSMPKARLKS
jgi:hypothetical protein